MTKLTLTKEQAGVAEAINEWFKLARNGGPRSLTLGGYAGTGKTTLLGQLERILPLGTRVVFASFTGKAVSVLRSKLPKGATVSTLHRLLYTPRQKTVCELTGEEAAQFYDPNNPVDDFAWYCWTHHPLTKEENRKNESCVVRRVLDFTPVENPLDDYDLVVVDEASMVSLKIWEDLTRWRVPVLAVGDHGQLPPVKSEFNLMENPNLRLETILRQAEESPIIQMATLARTTGHIPLGDYGAGCVKLARHRQPSALKHLRPEDGDLALCSFNKTRTWLNKSLRKRLVNPEDETPVPGDLVICLRNSHEVGVFNGMRGKIKDLGPVIELDHAQRFAVIELFGEDYGFEGEIAVAQFGELKTQSFLPRRLGLWDYGYAMTVHKSQGSQADRVLVIEEHFPQSDDEFHARLLYTAVTRAVRSLCVVGPA